jgi:hypothetical protein
MRVAPESRSWCLEPALHDLTRRLERSKWPRGCNDHGKGKLTASVPASNIDLKVSIRRFHYTRIAERHL